MRASILPRRPITCSNISEISECQSHLLYTRFFNEQSSRRDGREKLYTCILLLLWISLRDVASVLGYRTIQVIQGASVVSQAHVHQSSIAVQVRKAHIALARCPSRSSCPRSCCCFPARRGGGNSAGTANNAAARCISPCSCFVQAELLLGANLVKPEADGRREVLLVRRTAEEEVLRGQR